MREVEEGEEVMRESNFKSFHRRDGHHVVALCSKLLC